MCTKEAQPLRIVFMGTAPFAVPSLAALVGSSFQIVGVVTATDKPRGRGQRRVYSPVKQYALERGLTVLQPTNMKSMDFLNTLKSLGADFQVVVAFRMLPEAVWSMPALGTINLHASLLPQYRGAAPIHWAIIRGEQRTGVTTFFINHEIDTGNIIFQEEEAIYDTDDSASLHDRLMSKGAKLVLRTTEAIAKGQCKALPQHTPDTLKTAPKLFRNTCRINWKQRSTEIINFVRGLSPRPGAWMTIGNEHFKVFSVSTTPSPQDSKPIGTVVTDNKHYLKVCTSDGWVSIEEWQPAGKQRMGIATFFRGNNITP